jgi:hypothetical protein
MSFIEDEGLLKWSCDTCAEVKEAPSEKFDFHVCWRVLKGMGWRAERDDEDARHWWHHCPKCLRQQNRDGKELMNRVVRKPRPVPPPSIFGGPVEPAVLVEISPEGLKQARIDALLRRRPRTYVVGRMERKANG